MPRTGFPIPWRALHVPKHGNSRDEYEDAFAADAETGRFAIADGASESSFAGLWARLLVQGFVHPVLTDGPPDWLAPLRKRWAKEVDALELPWYAEEKREQGAYATFLGVLLKRSRKGESGQWRALAVGDSCLVQLREGRIVESFPVKESAEFGNHPKLLGSRTVSKEVLQRLGQVARGECVAGDRFLLMTDALAQWFLRQCEAKDKPWEVLARLQAKRDPDEAFADWIDERREQEEMRNDDVTLVTIEV